MAITPIFRGNDYVETGERAHVELQATERSEIQTLSTDGYAVGSDIFCVEDSSLWVLDYDSNGDLAWLEVAV